MNHTDKRTDGMKYLPLYKKWMKNGEIPDIDNGISRGGLCSIFYGDELFDLINPEWGTSQYWGYDYAVDFDYTPETGFTPLRQTVVLLMAAMNNEL